MSEGPYPIPSRTRKSSPPEPMVLRARVRGRVGRCQVYYQSPEAEMPRGFSYSVPLHPSERLPGLTAGFTPSNLVVVTFEADNQDPGPTQVVDDCTASPGPQARP